MNLSKVFFNVVSSFSAVIFQAAVFLDVARLSPPLIVGKKTMVFSPVTKNIKTKINNVYLKHTVVA